MRILQNVAQVELTDTFSQWRDTFNIVLDGIQETEFITNADAVTIQSGQTIDGAKTFNSATNFNNSISVNSGSSFIRGTALDISALNFNITSAANAGNVNFIGAKGFNLASNSTATSFNFGFADANSPSTLKLKYEGTGTFEVDSSVLLHLSGTSPKIKFGNSTWNLPNANPTTDSILRWNTSSGNIIWQTNADLASSLTPTISTTLSNDTTFYGNIGTSLSNSSTFIADIGIKLKDNTNFIGNTSTKLLANTAFQQGVVDLATAAFSAGGTTLAVELIPVGSTIDIDATAVAGWPANDIDVRFPGWLLLDGRTITTTQNSQFADLIKLIANNPNAIEATLPNSTTGSPSNFKIIKYKKDPIATFSLDDGDGISFTRSGQSVGDISLTSGISAISLKVNSSDFTFSSGGDLTLASNVARRQPDSDAIRSTAVPSDNTDLTNKLYVDGRITNTTTTLNSSITSSNARITTLENSVSAFTQSTFGSTITFGEKVDGLSYNDRRYTIAMINRDGVAVVNNDTTSSGLDAFNTSLYSYRVLGNAFQFANFKKSFNAVDQHFYLDEDDIIYAVGNNAKGQIGQLNRGTTNDYIGYYNQSDIEAPYAGAVVSSLLPALLPHKDFWPANAVTVDYLTGLVGDSSSTVDTTNLTVKTKDGIENRFLNENNISQGFIKYFDTNATPRAYTRGYLLSIGDNTYGQLGFGGVTATADIVTSATGPVVWGPIGQKQTNNSNFAGRTLWFNFGFTNEELNTTNPLSTPATRLNDSTFREKLFKRFNWFKPNSVLAGGLAPLVGDALAAWRTQTGLTTAPYSDYNWFIKKVFRTAYAQYAIIGKPGTELNNEIWCAGRNIHGAMSNNSTTDHFDFLPMLRTEISFIASTYALVGNVASGTVFQKSGATAHGFSDFERLILGSKTYIILTGDIINQNKTTQFRLVEVATNSSTVNSVNTAINILLTGTTTGLKNLANTGTSDKINVAGSYMPKLKGVYDINAISKYSDTVLLKVATEETANNDALDMLSETSISKNKVFSVGRNVLGECAVGPNNTSTSILNATETLFVSNAPDKINEILTISDSFSTTGTNVTAATSLLLDSNGKIWTCGSANLGLSSINSLSGNIRSWTEIAENTNFKFNKLFLTNFYTSATSSTAIDIRPRLFAIANSRTLSDTKTYLFAAGANHFGALGSESHVNAFTTRYLKIKFPENPANIVEIRGLVNQTLILCKTSGQNIGRVYAAGEDNRDNSEFISRSPISINQRQFRSVDKYIV